MKVVSVMSGIGGIEKGLETADMIVVAQVEIDAFCTRVLERHWPTVNRWSDIRDFNRMLSAEVSRVKTSRLLDKGKESRKEQEAVFGSRCLKPFAWLDRDTLSLKTFQQSLKGDSTLFSKDLPKAGMMRNGLLYKLPISGHCIRGKECSSSPIISTLTTTNSVRSEEFRKGCLPQIRELKHLLPTIGYNEYKGSSKKHFRNSEDFRGAKMSEGLRTCSEDPIYLNPYFAEAAMGFPIGWTELKPAAMQSFLKPQSSLEGE